MIARALRDRLAENLRHLFNGRITNRQFEDLLAFDVRDPALNEVYEHSAWQFYFDEREHRLRGSDAPSEDELGIAKRAILFLHSDREYEWWELPTEKRSVTGADVVARLVIWLWLVTALLLLFVGVTGPSVEELIGGSLMIGLPLACSVLGTRMRRRLLNHMPPPRRDEQGQLVPGCVDAWPFYTEADYQEARQRPRLLAGRGWHDPE
jgi:hypothetical protein